MRALGRRLPEQEVHADLALLMLVKCRFTPPKIMRATAVTLTPRWRFGIEVLQPKKLGPSSRKQLIWIKFGARSLLEISTHHSFAKRREANRDPSKSQPT